MIYLERATIIYNPTSGREQVQRHLPYIIQYLGDRGIKASGYPTTGPGSATTGAREAAAQGVGMVIAAGGDGTVYEVINGLAEAEYRPRVGVLPFGTTNDLARALGITGSIERACSILTHARQVPADVGKFNSRYFINIAAGGALTELTYEVPYRLKTIIGQLAYYLKGVEKLPFVRPVYAKIQYDKHIFEGDIMLFLVANTNSVGGFEKLAPNASISDGLFDLLIIKKAPIVKLAHLAGEILRGSHIKDNHVIYAQAANIKVVSNSGLPVNLDGEYGGNLPGEFINLPGHLSIMVP